MKLGAGGAGWEQGQGQTRASHKAMSYGRMEETKKRLREEVRKLLSQAEAADKEEDKPLRGSPGRRVAGKSCSDEKENAGLRGFGKPRQALEERAARARQE